LIVDINPGPASSNPSHLVAIGSTTYFTAYDGVHGLELWKSDGTAAGTTLVKDINPGSAGSNPAGPNLDPYLTNVNGTLFFAADDGAHGTELWKSDGTAAGTTLVKDIFPGGDWGGYYGSEYFMNSSSPGGLTNVNGQLLFTADDGTNGRALWKSDGTADGTVLVKDINPWGSSDPGSLTNVNGTVFFSAYGGTDVELWKSDGTAAGTVLVKDINPGWASSVPEWLTNVNGTLFFQANDATTGRELWRSDGTAAGTALVKGIRPGSASSYPSSLTNVNGTLFFSANDGTTGSELWRSDGTAEGTVLVKDINPTNIGGGSDPNYLVNVNGTLFFRAYDGGTTTGLELWRSDGTAAGTTLVKDINPGYGWSTPQDLTNVNGTLFFTADDGTGSKLWHSDGTAAGTVPIANLLSANLTNVNGTLFFEADDGVHGGELWKLDDDPNALPALNITDVMLTIGNAGTSTARFTVYLSGPSSETVTVRYATADGTAAAGSDYQPVSDTLTFAPGETSKTVTVLVIGDRIPEPNERFVVNLSNPTNATILDGQGVGTIVDDEPRISITDVTKAEGRKNQTTLFTFTVTLSAAYDQPVTVSFHTVDGTAKTSDNDYVAKSGTLTFNPGETTKTITIVVIGDSKREADEMFYLDLFGNSSNSLFTRNRGIGTILNDD
jgi:ELWxxDGT repeat protein